MDISSLQPFRKDGSLNVIVESPRGATIKMKYDGETGLMMMSRPLIAGLTYPHDWGFIPGTRGPDGDPADAMVLWDQSSYPGTLIPCRIIGMLSVDQKQPSGERVRNDRVMAVPVKDARCKDLQSIDDLPMRTRRELERFFLSSVAFEGKDLHILDWAGVEDARAFVLSQVSDSQELARTARSS